MSGAGRSFGDSYTKAINSQEKGFLSEFDNSCRGINTYYDRIKYNADLPLIPNAPEPRFISNGTKLTCLMGIGESRLSLWNSHGTNDSAPDAVIATDTTFTLFSECQNPLNPTKLCTGKLLTSKWQNTHKGSTINQEEKVTVDSFLICEFRCIVKAKDNDDGQVFISAPTGNTIPLMQPKPWYEVAGKFLKNSLKTGSAFLDSLSVYAGAGTGFGAKISAGTASINALVKVDLFGFKIANGKITSTIQSSASISAGVGPVEYGVGGTSERVLRDDVQDVLWPIGDANLVEWGTSDRWSEVESDSTGTYSIGGGLYKGVGFEFKGEFDQQSFIEDFENIWSDDE